MKKYAIGFINFFDNELVIEILEGNDWREVTLKHSKTLWDSLEENNPDDFENLEDAENEIPSVVPKTLEQAKEDAFNRDGAFDCVEIDSC